MTDINTPLVGLDNARTRGYTPLGGFRCPNNSRIWERWIPVCIHLRLKGHTAMRSHKPAAIVCLAVVVILFLLLLAEPVCHDRADICAHTGSRREYRQWFWGRKTSEVYTESKLEAFMKEQYADVVRNKWVSYRGTGRNVLGCSISSGHGEPGPMVLLVRSGMLDHYVEGLDGLGRKALYDLFASGDGEAVEARAQEIRAWSADRTQKPD